MALVTAFEKETCGRCGGSGQYSYNQTDGSRCFGCAGKGERLTKRGAAASKHFNDACMVRASSLEVGHIVKVSGVTQAGGGYSYFAEVTAIEPAKVMGYTVAAGERKPIIYIGIVTDSPKLGKLTCYQSGETLMRKGQTGAEKASKIADALAYQATLTQAGTPRKRKQSA